MKDFVDTFVSLISGVVVTSVTADLAVRVTLFTLLAGFAVTFLTETTVSLTVLGDADLAVLVAEERLRVAINVKKYRKKREGVGHQQRFHLLCPNLPYGNRLHLNPQT